MRFGKSYDERSKPYKWFAWYPVCDYETGVIVWLEYVIRTNYNYSNKFYIIPVSQKEGTNENTSTIK